jgi:hypothetical protein
MKTRIKAPTSARAWKKIAEDRAARIVRLTDALRAVCRFADEHDGCAEVFAIARAALAHQQSQENGK